MSSEDGRVVLYIRCYGTGELTIEVSGTAKITQPCVEIADDPGTLNQIQVLKPESFTVRGSADNSNLWSIAVTQPKATA